MKSGWRRVKVGEVVQRHVERCDDAQARSYAYFVGVDDLDPGDLRLRRSSSLEEDGLPPTFRYVFPEGSVLFPTRRPALNKLAVAPFGGLTGEKILVLVPRDSSTLAPGFLPYLLSTGMAREWVVARAIGSVTPHFRWRDLAEYEFALPPPEEQRRFTTLLRLIEATRERELEAASALETMRCSWLEDEFSNPCDSGLTLDQIADIRSGGTPKRSRADFWAGDIPWLSPKDMRSTVLEDTSEHISGAALKDRASALAPPGTLFIVVRGMILAHTFPITRSTRPMAFNQDIKALVPKEGFEPIFVQAFLEWASHRFLRLVAETSHGTKRLETKHILSLRVSGKSVKRQREIGKILRDFDTAIAALDERSSRCWSIRTDILGKLSGLT